MKGKYQKTPGKKSIALLLALMLLIGCVAGGTIAYLATRTPAVQNTFVSGNIGDLKLTETSVGTGTDGAYIVVPGTTITKNPTITFNNNNVAAYVFLKVEEEDWTVVTTDETTHTYTKGGMSWVLEGWKKLSDGVYYKEVAANAGAQTWYIIKGDTITVTNTVNAATIAEYNTALNFTAYAIQQEGVGGIDAAWTQVSALAEPQT